MSRFGLRSNADGFKISEDKFSRRKLCKSTSATASIKRALQQKDNEDNAGDEKNLELKDIEGTFDPTNPNDDDGDEGLPLASAIVKGGALVCRLPLERITDIIQKLNLNKTETDIIDLKETNDQGNDEVEEVEDEEEDEDKIQDVSLSKPTTAMIKILCLYCDKKFSSHKMQLKHVDKFHCQQPDRRCSVRNALVQQTSGSRKRKSNIGQQSFPGCTYCQKAKGQQIQLPAANASDLNALFIHLADCHADRYFGCKTCVLRFQNIGKLSKHMQIVHKSLPFAFDENSKSKDNDSDLIASDKQTISERSRLSVKRQQRSQTRSTSSSNFVVPTMSVGPQCSTAISTDITVIGAEEPILSRLGLTQNRLPNNRKGVRLRRENLLPEALLKSEQNPTTNFTSPPTPVPATCSPKLRGKAIKHQTNSFVGDATTDVIFRVPTRNDILSCVFDDNFYKEVVSNVRNNLLFHIDGKIMGTALPNMDTILIRHAPQPQIRSTLVKSPIVLTTMDSEIHAATSLAAVTAFPTLLTAKQYGGDATSAKIRRPHTKNSWKWKWDSVKKFKLVNEGGKIVKKMKHPMFGLRDLSKLDMWTQLTMRQKHEHQHHHQQQQLHHLQLENSHPDKGEFNQLSEVFNDPCREEKQRLNDQLNLILDMRLLPHIILEQSEQAIIKVENDEFGIGPTRSSIDEEDCTENIMNQTFADESFLSMLNLIPKHNSDIKRQKLVLSGEWARPRCYLCMCCGAKFEKIKSLEEHKMFRHSHILSTHYEVVGRELLAGNLLRHLFIPKKALSRYGNEHISLAYSGAARRLFWRKNEILTREITNNDESSDSLQSILNSCATNSPSAKHSCIEDCDTDTKTTTATTPDMVNNTIVSPAHSIQSCSSSASASKHMKTQANSRSLSSSAINGNSCSKCGRKCNGTSDLYRHMLDCSGDYIWSMAKKRKYRYYCGSKKRRPCNKHNILELRKNKPKPAKTPPAVSVESEEATSPNFAKTKTPPRPRPSDAESIKKMLENLPPKRICKKIFPLLNKSKKPPNMKPRLRVKHKIYRSLRKTRMRQMSQAAKILSKSKSQLHKKKRLPRTTPVTVVRERKTKGLKIEANKTFRKKEIKSFKQQASESIIEDAIDVVDSPRKTKIESESDLPGNKNGEPAGTNFITEKRLTPKKSSSSSLMLNTDGEPNKTPASEEAEKLLQTPKKSIKQLGVQVDSAVYSEQISKNENNVSDKTSQAPLNISESNANRNSGANALATSFIEQEKIAQTNKNVKRSKRISDCIAMLTGKLEEKLKTEQKITTPTKIIERAMDIEVTVTPEKPKTPPLQTIVTPIIEHSKVQETDSNSILSPKKTPKRKTISRRIIKAPSSVSTSGGLKVLPEQETTPIISTMATKAKVTITSNSIKDSTALKHKHSTSMLMQNVAAAKQITTDVKLANINTPVLAPPTLPKVLPVCALNMMPKVPLYIPVDNLRAAAPHLLPLPLPMPVPVALPVENVTQISPDAGLSTTTAAAVAGISLVAPTLSMVSAVPAHLQGPAALPYTVPGFNAEPLNLSNASKGLHKQNDASQDLSYSGSQRTVGGIPARRQTICGGFEARNFAIFEDMEPLDLSKKPRPEKNSNVTLTNASHQKPVDMVTPLLLPPPLPGPSTPGLQPADVPVTALPSLTSELLLNKQFYSNLDLLRIPQVRNPTAGPMNNDLTLTNMVNQSCINTAPTTSINNTTATSTCATKPSSKKRNNKTSNLAFTAVALSGTTQNNDTPSNAQSASIKTKETSKSKDACGKNKGVLKMDEEVINHIDDAINSVINAVKASLKDSEDAEKSQNQLCSKTTDDVVPANPVPCIELKSFTPAKRNMRSKTLDYRPAALSKQNLLPNAIIPVQQQITDNVLKNNAVMEVSAQMIIETHKEEIARNDPIVVKSNTSRGIDEISSGKALTKTDVETKKLSNKEQIPLADSSKAKEPDDYTKPITTNQDKTQNNELIKTQIIIDNKVQTVKDITPSEKSEKVLISSLSSNAETESVANTTNTTTNNTLELEQVNSNINNTSSGFHSSAQSDLATATSVTATAVADCTAPDASKKKQRRRRKNELAAIVADQLLESFKIDKARRDNLKKLENLAYEKSEDLLLTGMLLMSSTKRIVASGTGSTTTVESIESSSNSGANKRNNKNQRQPPTHEIIPALVVSETIPVAEQDKVDGNGSNVQQHTQIEKATEKEAVDTKKPNNKRRQYRRRGKVLDNENISKLKSSLESFSIDIERQLNEFEAKNVNVFKNVGSDMKTVNNSTVEQSSTSAKSSVILRPSILSMTLEAVNQNNNSQASKTAPSDTNKSAVSSRDPRLNKNIHKEDGTPAKKSTSPKKNGTTLDEIGDVDEDNYLTEIAKNVNEKIMSTENEEFAFKDDGFELVNEMPDDSNSKFSRPPTSMSVRSAPNFNDDRSNFGSICDENTNTEAMDMDLDDEMSVYTSYSQDLGRGRGRRRRRRRSILLTRKPKKRATSRDLSSEKIECVLCKKTFYSANSLAKHNMTLAHVSKVSEQEYLLSKTMAISSPSVVPVEQSQHNSLGPYARRLTRRATISEPPRQLSLESRPSSPSQLPSLQHDPTSVILQSTPIRHLSFKQLPINPETSSAIRENTQSEEVVIAEPRQKSSITSKESPPLNETNVSANSRLNLNPDERLFFECCNILKGAETPRITADAGNNLDANYTYTYKQEKTSTLPASNVGPRDPVSIGTVTEGATRRPLPPALHNSVQPIIQMATEPSNVFRDPQIITAVGTGNSYNKQNQERSTRSPTYSAISQLSAVTNTTSRFKTKAAMKGYENVNIDLALQQHESKSRTICKLTELAEIALGTEEKPPSSHQYSPIQNSTPPPELLSAPLMDAAAHAAMSANIHMNTPEYVTLSVVDNQKNCMPQLGGRNERAKNNETRSSTSSKTIMHSSIIKAAVEEHQKPTINNKIIIPDRPFKNIGLEEKETITFQKPKTPAVNLLNDDNSVSTASFSDRDDYDFGSLSCDDEGSLREGNEKNIKNDSTDSSTESSRATAKTFENKSLIMGRIFKNATTKTTVKNALTAVKVKSVGVQKDQTPIPKADLNQLFDELRGNSRVEVNANERTATAVACGIVAPLITSAGISIVNNSRKEINNATARVSSATDHLLNKRQQESCMPSKGLTVHAASPPAVVSSTTTTPGTNAKKGRETRSRTNNSNNGTGRKARKDISKLQTELGMSPDEIKKLIDEGQRKSKRRCATNRPKKLVEMWSSDEYEEFLSTKDIIALIEEKEQQEKRRKRKTSINLSSNNSEVAKEKDGTDVTSSTRDNRRRITRTLSIATEREDLVNTKIIQTGRRKSSAANNPGKGGSSGGRDELVSTTAKVLKNTSGVRASNTNKSNKHTKMNAEVVSTVAEITKNHRNSSRAKTRSKSLALTNATKAKATNSRRNSSYKAKSSKLVQSEGDNDDEEAEDDDKDMVDDDDDDDEDFLISELKKNNKTRARAIRKPVRKAMASASAAIVTSTGNEQTSRKRGSNNNNTNYNNSNLVQNKQQQHTKAKRKSQTNQSSPRRKRIATEKLYYWSSSSDEDFGRINSNNKSHVSVNASGSAATDNYDCGAEQYQKHGWIVGDSHKKLVTLLAIAKGNNKKVDSNCGVKKNVTKRRN